MKIPFRRKGVDEEELEKEAIPKSRRRRKKEAPKPWGKTERFLVLGVLVSTIAIAALLALNAREWKLPGLPRLSLPKGVFEQTYVFEGKRPARDRGAIVDEFSKLTQDTSGVYGLYVISLNSDERYGVNEDEPFQAASLMKLPVMAAMYSEHEKGNVGLDDIYTLRNEDKVGGSGGVFYQEAGTKYSYRELVSAMGQQSDNTAFNIAVQLLGEEFIQEYIKEVGMGSTSYEQNQTTPRDVGTFFKSLWQMKIVERASRDEILKSLTGTIYEDHLAAGITDVRVAHKFGREVHVVNDAGIVFDENPYVLIIMSKGVVEAEADKLIPELAASVNRFETAGK
jgi:beta-lactamase class A